MNKTAINVYVQWGYRTMELSNVNVSHVIDISITHSDCKWS